MFTAVATNNHQTEQSLPGQVSNAICAATIILILLYPNYTSISPIPNMSDVVQSPISISVESTSANNYANFHIATNYENEKNYDGVISFHLDGVANMSTDLSQSLHVIEDIGSLQDNWNGNGASAFSDKLLMLACQFVRSIGIQPQIFPTARDSIQFEYENNDGDYLEFELFETGDIKMFSFDHAGNENTKKISVNEVNKVVNEFYG